MTRGLAVGIVSAVLVLQVAGGGDRPDPHKIPAAAQAILERAESFELLSLDPSEPRDAPKEGFHGFAVLGKLAIDKAEVRKQVVEAFVKGVAAYKGGGARCFRPRHGLRAKYEGKSAEFVICFECRRVHVYVEGGAKQAFLVSDSPSEVFNKVLKSAGVELPPPPKK